MPRRNCHRKGCYSTRSEFTFFLRRRRAPHIEGYSFCSHACVHKYFKNELKDRWERLRKGKTVGVHRPKIGTILLQSGSITPDQLNAAVNYQSQTGEGLLGEWLQRLGFLEERQVTQALSKQYGIPWINLSNFVANRRIVKMIPGKVARSSKLLPVGYDDAEDYLRVAVTPPVHLGSQEAIRRMLGKGVRIYIGDQSAIHRLQDQAYRPEELDLSSDPTYQTLDELLGIARKVMESAIDRKADNVNAELLQDYLWVRLDFDGQSHHQFYRHGIDHVRRPHFAANERTATPSFASNSLN